MELARPLAQFEHVRLIAIKNLREAAAIYPDVATVIEDFYQIIKAASWHNLEEVKQSFSSAEAVGNFTVFNIKGNRYRLILSINYQKQMPFLNIFSLTLIMTRTNGKMTLTTNSKVYGELLAQYQPKIIATEEENERVLALVESLTHKSDLTPEEEQLLDLLIALIEKFEAEHYPLNNLSTPLSRLTFLMEENHLRQADLIEVFGSKDIASEVLSGKRQIGKSHALKLGEFFNLNPALFLL